LAFIQSEFFVFQVSRVMVSENKQYFAYIHIANVVVADRLQEITAFP
jgi:hypothetical protein